MSCIRVSSCPFSNFSTVCIEFISKTQIYQDRKLVFIFLNYILILAPPGPPCPSFYLVEESLGLCFNVYTLWMDWFAARAHCQAEGTDLVVLDSPALVTFMLDHVIAEGNVFSISTLSIT